MITALAVAWLSAGLSFYASQKYNRSSFEAVFVLLSLLLHGALVALLIFNNVIGWVAIVPILFMAIVAAAAISGNEATRKQKLFRAWLELQIGLALTVLSYILIPIVEINPLILFSFASLLVAVIAMGLLFLHLRRYRIPETTSVPLENQPTVSLLIPARNEDHALKQALTAVTESDYAKLEVLVLDDCSHDKTPEIIRGFAHDGVRFIEGSPPPEDWLGKNYALEQLRQAASGELLLFCDVDVTLKPHTVTKMVELIQQEDLAMLSLLPQRRVFDAIPTLLRPLTDFLLSILPFHLLDTRAAIGTCYAVRAKTLAEFNGYEDVKNEIFPEFTFTKRILKSRRYKFYFGRDIGVQTRKHFGSQEDTLTRILFPAINKDLLLAYASLLIGAVVILPYVYLIINPGSLAILAALLWSATYAISMRAIHGRTALLALIQFPLLVVHEMVLLLVSIYKYMFAKVIWKERNICLPALETEPQLPKLD